MSTSAPTSTPMKQPSSRKIASDTHTPVSSRLQEQLKSVMEDEIGSQAWQFDTDRVCRMLSPRVPKKGDHLDLRVLDNYDCDVDKSGFIEAHRSAVGELSKKYPELLAKPLDPSTPNHSRSPWRTDPGERPHYEPLAAFLNTCVELGVRALDQAGLSSSGRWYDDLSFVTYDKSMVDGVGGAAALKPDLAGGNGVDVLGTNTLYWSPPEGHKGPHMQLPVEVKKNMRDLVSQSATYARCLFSAHPSRTFALVLAFNHTQRELRFLIFHRSGLTSTKALKLEDRKARADTLRLIMTLLLWSTPQHAGFVDTTNDFMYLIPQPSNPEDWVWADVKGVLHNSECVRGRATRVCLVSCQREPGPSTAAAPAEPIVDNFQSTTPASLKPATQTTVLRRSPRLKLSQTETTSPAPTEAKKGDSKPKGSQTRKGESKAKGSQTKKGDSKPKGSETKEGDSTAKGPADKENGASL
ncbi:hypothetical protein B0H10DRAFT_1979950 [Mycena sp. CBHHK59/15]|nr:hypothetical protein B0H10DRAFT_1979950 [Mycena sp. CBHHK59/15]